MIRAKHLVALGAFVLAIAGCERVDLERMIRQRKCVPYSTCQWLPDNRTMQHAPSGTVPRNRIVGNPALTQGTVDGEPVTAIPREVDLALLQRGRQRFEIYCAACHGVLGTGDTQVAKNMQLRRPPSLHEPRITELPPGRLFRIITEGYGLMPNFAAEISLEDRWAVVAYVSALQLSQRVVLQEQPEQTRRAIEEALR